MYSEDLLKEGLKKCSLENYDDDFISAAVQLNDKGEAIHAGIYFNCNEGTYLFHFLHEVKLETEFQGDWYYFKSFEFIDSRLSSAFLSHCKAILRNDTEPEWSSYFDGGFYDENGKFHGKYGECKILSCVGFCLSVLKDFVTDDDNEDFFSYNDWQTSDVSENFKNNFINHVLPKLQQRFPNENLTSESIRENFRRIKPVEYLASAYIKILPIYKSEIDKFVEVLSEIIANKVIVLKEDEQQTAGSADSN